MNGESSLAAAAATGASEPSPPAMPSASAPPFTALATSAERSSPGPSTTASTPRSRLISKRRPRCLAVAGPRIDEQHGSRRIDGLAALAKHSNGRTRSPPRPRGEVASQTNDVADCRARRGRPVGWRKEIGKLDVALYAAVAATSTPGLDRRFRGCAGCRSLKLWSECRRASAAGGRRGQRAAVNGLVSVALSSAVVNMLLKPLSDVGGRIGAPRGCELPPRGNAPLHVVSLRPRGSCRRSPSPPVRPSRYRALGGLHYRHRSPGSVLTGPHRRALPERRDRRVGHRCRAGSDCRGRTRSLRRMRAERDMSTPYSPAGGAPRTARARGDRRGRSAGSSRFRRVQVPGAAHNSARRPVTRAGRRLHHAGGSRRVLTAHGRSRSQPRPRAHRPQRG